ncbi:TetR-like C-terminal domain-containing protein [Kribbella capetownensis]|uniref:TetR-like C-terminal domain-containing protein n=1 Tax=Kribbella capetownensis TaxID=1572659 RepID=UPI0023575D15|nr:TetR-like C-terminal domain-containing protein [Kribbella capetownensis]
MDPRGHPRHREPAWRCARRPAADIVHGLLAEAPDLDPEVSTRMTGVMVTIVRRAAARGEIPTADVPDRVLTAPTNLLRHGMLFTREPVAESTLTSLVDDVFLPLVRVT